MLYDDSQISTRDLNNQNTVQPVCHLYIQPYAIYHDVLLYAYIMMVWNYCAFIKKKKFRILVPGVASAYILPLFPYFQCMELCICLVLQILISVSGFTAAVGVA